MPVNVTSGVTPGPPQQATPRLDVSQLVQVLQANKERKDVKTAEKKQADRDKVALLMELSGKMPIDAKAFGDALKGGYDINLGDTLSAPGPVDLKPQEGAALGGAMQGVQEGGQAGAAAAFPPSRSAAAKAPGEGVTKPAIPSSGQSGLQSTLAQQPPGGGPLGEMLSENYQMGEMQRAGETAGLQQQELMMNLFKKAAGDPKQGIKPDPVAAAHFSAMTKMQDPKVPFDDTAAAIYLSGNPEQRAEIAETYGKYNEIKEVPERETKILESLIATEGHGGVFNPKDYSAVAKSFARGTGIPDGVQVNPSATQIAEITNRADKLAALGMPVSEAYSAAKLGVLSGMSMQDALTVPFKSFETLVQHKMRMDERETMTSRLEAETRASTEEREFLQAQQATVPEGATEYPSFLWGSTFEDAHKFMEVSEKVKHSDLQTQLNSLRLQAEVLSKDGGDSMDNERFALQLQDFQERTQGELGSIFQYDSVDGKKKWWKFFWNKLKISGPSAAERIGPLAGPSTQVPEGVATVKPPVAEKAARAKAEEMRQTAMRLREFHKTPTVR